MENGRARQRQALPQNTATKPPSSEPHAQRERRPRPAFRSGCPVLDPPQGLRASPLLVRAAIHPVSNSARPQAPQAPRCHRHAAHAAPCLRDRIDPVRRECKDGANAVGSPSGAFTMDQYADDWSEALSNPGETVARAAVRRDGSKRQQARQTARRARCKFLI